MTAKDEQQIKQDIQKMLNSTDVWNVKLLSVAILEIIKKELKSKQK